MDLDKLITLTILLVITIGPITTIIFYWNALVILLEGIWNALIENPQLQVLMVQIFFDKSTTYIIANFTYLIIGVLINILPFNINGSKMFWIIYGILLFVVNGSIAIS